MLGFYVHFPYCLQRCTYCDFATDIYKNEEKNTAYFLYLAKEIELSSNNFKNKFLTSIYFGGGTPSLVSPHLYHQFFNDLKKNGFSWDKNTEISIEINPDTVDTPKLKEYIDLGFNRFSLGVQTFDNELLKKVGRLHSAENTLRNLEDLQGLNFSCDLLYSLPGQNISQVEQDLLKILSFKPTHISPYILTLPRQHKLQGGRAPEEEQVDMMHLIHRTLTEHHFEQYEISNYAKDSYKSQHNYNAWKGHEYWGIGMSAHSYLHDGEWGVRFSNPNTVSLYEKLLNKKEIGLAYQCKEQNIEQLKLHEALTDFCHTSLRLREGLSFSKISSRFGEKALNKVKFRISGPQNEGFIEPTSDGVRLTWQGILFSNQVFEDFLFLAEDNLHLDDSY